MLTCLMKKLVSVYGLVMHSVFQPLHNCRCHVSAVVRHLSSTSEVCWPNPGPYVGKLAVAYCMK